MFCKNCGNRLNDGDKFCNSCGTSTEVTTEETITEEVQEPVVSEPVIEEVKESVPEEPVVNNNVIEPVINSEPVPAKKSNGGLIALFIILGVLVLGGIIFGVIMLLKPHDPKPTPTTDINIKTADKEETITYEGYTFTVPDGYLVNDSTGVNIIGNNKFKFQILGIDSFYSYSDYASKDTLEYVKKYIPESTAKFLNQTEETYNGKKFLIFSFDRSGTTADAIITELSDGKVLMIFAYYNNESDKKDGYNNLAKFVTSATKESTTTTETDKTDTTEDYMVMGDDTLGYVKLPGSWFKGTVAGATESSLQYFRYDTAGKFIVTLDVLDKTKYTDAKASASVFEAVFKTDSDATNIKTESSKIGKYDAYKVYVQYKSDSVWVVSWFFKADDGLIHMIQVEGLDTTHEYFKIPNTFSLTKIK